MISDKLAVVINAIGIVEDCPCGDPIGGCHACMPEEEENEDYMGSRSWYEKNV